MKPVLVSIAKKTGYVLAALVIMAALLVAVSRVLTPYLDARRGDIENWASDVLHAPIQIERARLSWFQYQPGVALYNVSLLDNKTKAPVLQVNKIKVFFSIPQSLWQHKLVPSGIVIDGADLVVHQDASGEFSVQGFPAMGGFDKAPYKDESKIRDVVGWLSLQPLLILRDVDVRYTGIGGLKRFVTLNNLRMDNTAADHHISGQAVLHQDIATEVTMTAQWQGNPADLQSIDGKIYLYVSGLSLGQWLKGLAWKGWEIKKGLASAKIWAAWHHGSLQLLQTTMQVLNLDLYSSTDKSMRNINRFSGDLGWKLEGENPVIAGDDILIDGATHLWPVTSFYLRLMPDAKQQLQPVTMNIGYLDIGDVRNILASSPEFLPVDVMKTITDLNLTGSIENINAAFTNEAGQLMPTKLQARFDHISFQSIRQFPAIKNFAALLDWKSGGGSLTLLGNNTEVQYDSLYTHPVNLGQLSGTINWQQANDTWKLDFKAVNILNQDLALTLNGDVTMPVTLKPTVNLSANYSFHQAARVFNYLPSKKMGKKLQEWLSHAFLSGSIPSGSMVLRGALADFPFAQHNGEFTANAVVNNVRLHYAPEWPDLNNIYGNVNFDGNEIIIDVDRAKMEGLDIGKTHGSIPGITDDKPSTLTVNTAPINADFSQGMNFLHHSPLEKTIGKMFQNVAPTGPIAITLMLKVPLIDPDKTKVKGVISITNASLNLVPWKLDVTKLSGNVNFTESTTQATAMTAELFGKPLRLDIDSIKNSRKEAIVRATIMHEIDLRDIEKWLKLSLSPIATGSANVETQLDLAIDKPIIAHMQSNLRGITLDLPDNFGKKADEVRQLKTDITIEDGQPLKIKFDYASLLNAAILLTQQKDHFTLLAADLRLGSGEAAWPASNGLYITGNLKSIDDARIKPYMSGSGKNTSAGLTLRGVDVVIDDVNLYGIHLTKTRLQMEPVKNNWKFNITSSEVTGNVYIPVDFTSSGTILADLDRINLDAISQRKNNSIDITAKTLPAIKFSADSLTYRGAHLGAVSFDTSSSSNGLKINSFNIHTPNMNLQASGDWIQKAKNSVSRLHGKSTSKNVSAVLNDLGFDAHNFVASNGNLDFDLSWAAPPYALTLESMSGQASMNMGKGRIVEVSESTNAKMDLGRMLNLFSLQSIPRRLTFDFSDVFQKGYSFDSLRGDFNFNRGVTKTKNMRFDGPIARVEIRGDIGIDKKYFDLVINVTPYVTSSIPVAATLLTGQPVIGIAAWAVNKMLSSEVSKATTYSYAVTGSWDNPQWNVIKQANGQKK